jgi:Spy/CpxP family protein refolding chaperone
MKALTAIAFVAAFLIATVVVGQQPQGPGQHPQPPNMPPGPGMPNHPHPPPNPDPLAHLLFPPDMIMSHARQLNLTDEQKQFMRSEIQKTTASFQDLQWKLQDQMESFQETMKSPSVNEEQALAQLDRVLKLEREIKRLHISLAVRLKNQLTPEQQEQLHKWRADHQPPTPGTPETPPNPEP